MEEGGRGVCMLFGDGSVGQTVLAFLVFCVFLWAGQEVVMILLGKRGGGRSPLAGNVAVSDVVRSWF